MRDKETDDVLVEESYALAFGRTPDKAIFGGPMASLKEFQQMAEDHISNGRP